MSIDWAGIILDSQAPETAWASIFSSLLDLAKQSSSPVALHDATVIPDRLLSEAAWELWESYPEHAVKTSAMLKDWTSQGSAKAVLILDALSLRELPILLSAAAVRGADPLQVNVTGSECPSTTDQFAKAIGLSSRSALANDTKPGTFSLFGGNCYTDVVSMPFEDCAVPPAPNIVIWHTWLDDLIHLQKKLPDQIASLAAGTLQGDGFWNFVNKLRQGRRLVITSDHGYAVSKRFSSEVDDPEAVENIKRNLRRFPEQSRFRTMEEKIHAADCDVPQQATYCHGTAEMEGSERFPGCLSWRHEPFGSCRALCGDTRIMNGKTAKIQNALPGMALPEAAAEKNKKKVRTSPAVNHSGLLPENLGKAIRLPVPDFSDPNRKPTCLEADFPIAQINALSNLEGNAGKPIYQMSKWWARRRSSVFRSMLIAAATEAPDDPNEAAKRVWDHYYCNHQKAGSFKKLRVLDCFMGGGTTLVEGSRLGMQMTGVDLNPVAWFVVKNELACSDPEQVKALFEYIESQVKPQIQPFYTTTCPRGHQGRWIDVQSGEAVEIEPMDLSPEQRPRYRWEGPEVIYTFWAKHGPCQAKGCGHRTPIFRTPVIAEKNLSTNFIECTCPKCAARFSCGAWGNPYGSRRRTRCNRRGYPFYRDQPAICQAAE